jgi:lipoprotein-anchoring transpeptidase ErfK/SrfK
MAIPEATLIAPRTQASATEPTPAPQRMLRLGDSGPDVAALKDRLRQLKYVPGRGDVFDARTRDAVMAAQKVNGIGRDGIVGPQTRAALADPVRPRLGSGPDDRIIVDLSDQVAYLVRDGSLGYVMNVSTGNPNLADGEGMATPKGRFRITRKSAGARVAPLGTLYWPSYFVGGVAFHGSNFVPPYPDSHGCVRVPRWAERMVYDDLPVGHAVRVRD